MQGQFIFKKLQCYKNTLVLLICLCQLFMIQLQRSLEASLWNHMSQETSPDKHSNVSILLCHDISLVDIVDNVNIHKPACVSLQ